MFDREILAYLAKWKDKKSRKPLILRGARQVGKTFAVKLFAEKHFEELVYINMDKAEDYELFRDVRTLSEFEKISDIVLKKKMKLGSTLLFIDEIQNTPNLIELLRFFYEEKPGLHVIAAGSLLEAVIDKEGLAMPVGRVEYAYLYPLTFFEFLGAVKEEGLLAHLKKVTRPEDMPLSIHKRAMKLFFDYALVGGMPEVVSLYARKSPQEEINSLYSSLLTAYAEDIFKYATSADVKYIKHVLEQAPQFAGERITYEKFGGSMYRSREMSEAFAVMEKAMIVRQIPATQSSEMPLVARIKRAKKILFLDVGFINFKNNIQADYIKLDELSDLYRGRVAEQIVGQNIIASDGHLKREVYYWAKEKTEGTAEVDFCFSCQGKIIGVEVKAGHSAKLGSLFSFARSVKKSRLVRIYGGSFRKEQVSNAGEKYELLSLPFYLVNRVFDFCS